MARNYTCTVCGAQFSLPPSVQQRYPNWTPKRCRRCHGQPAGQDATTAAARPATQPRAAGPAATAASGAQLALDTDGGEDPVTSTEVHISAALEQQLQELLQLHHAGPDEGLFTDGGCSGNPGPGGWGAAWVREGKVVWQARGEHPHTTNNRMELTALIAAYRVLQPDQEVTVWTDSQLCVNTFTQWAHGWARKGWRRKGGPIKNLDLVQPLYQLVCAHPGARLTWLKGHDGSRWNEYVDLLATAHIKRR